MHISISHSEPHAAWRQLLRRVQTSPASGHVHGGVENPNPAGVGNLKHAVIIESSHHAGVGNPKHAMFSKESTHVVYSNSVCSVIV